MATGTGAPPAPVAKTGAQEAVVVDFPDSTVSRDTDKRGGKPRALLNIPATRAP